MVVQELVSGMDCYQLREILGRRPYAPSPFGGGEGLPGHYTELGLVPVSSKEYFYDELFHDADHLEVYLRQVPALLSDWRFSPRPYEPLRDRAALDLYVRYNTTAGGVRLRRRRHVFVLHWTHMAPYPVDGEDAQPRSARATPGGAARVPRATPGGGLQLLAANLSGTSGSWQWVPLRAILLYDGGIRSDG